MGVLAHGKVPTLRVLVLHLAASGALLAGSRIKTHTDAITSDRARIKMHRTRSRRSAPGTTFVRSPGTVSRFSLVAGAPGHNCEPLPNPTAQVPREMCSRLNARPYSSAGRADNLALLRIGLTPAVPGGSWPDRAGGCSG